MAVLTTIISAPVGIGTERIVNAKKTSSFDLEVFLAGNGGGANRKYKAHDIIFAQGDPCDGVFYVQEGKCKMTVVSERGKEPWSRCTTRVISLVKAV